MTWFGYDKVAEVDQPMGSALILNKAAVRDVGLMDEGFPIFFNEVDWLYRAKQKGWEVYFVPDATVVHHGASSTKQVKRRAMVRESHKSLLRFYAKHFRGRISAPAYYFTTACIRLEHAAQGLTLNPDVTVSIVNWNTRDRAARVHQLHSRPGRFRKL